MHREVSKRVVVDMIMLHRMIDVYDVFADILQSVSVESSRKICVID